MERQEETTIVVTDANVLINLIHVDRLGMLAELPGYRFVVTDEAKEEIKYREQEAALDAALGSGHIGNESITTPEELRIYAELADVMGQGEASCIALAESRGWHVASDEQRRFRRVAEERLGPDRIVTTPWIYLAAINAGVIKVEEADEDKMELEKHRFKMKFGSFRDVVGEK